MTLHPFTRVFDRDTNGLMVVLGSTDTLAEDFHMTDEITLADVYSEYPSDSLVYHTAYEAALDDEYPDWRALERDELAPQISIDVPSIRCFHPAAKLRVHGAGNYTELPTGVRCEFCERLTESTAAWAEHAAGDHIEVDV